MNTTEVRMYQILQETGLSDDRASEAVSVMKELQQQSLDHLATKADLELLSIRLSEKLNEFQRDMTEKLGSYQRDMTEQLSFQQRDMTEKLSLHQRDMTEKLSLHQTSVAEKMNRHQSDLAEKMSRCHRNTIVWVVSTVATGVTLAIGLFSLAIRYLL